MGINIIFTEANGNFSGKKEMIENAAKVAEDYVFPRLKIDWDVDLVVTNHMPRLIIPEDGVGGRTYWCDLICICVDFDRMTGAKLSEMLVHELCHAARWGKNGEYMMTLFDGLVNEGIATYFEAEFAKNLQQGKQFFIQTIIDRPDGENEIIFEKLRDQLDSEKYDYETIFFNGNNGLPRWSGYSLGYYLVRKYLAKTGKKIEQAFSDKYADFRREIL